MIFRNLMAKQAAQEESGYEAFLKTQEAPGTPFGLIFQSEHSRLAGELAEALTDEPFGKLSDDVIAAIRHHDFGWDASDGLQLERLKTKAPVSFTQVSSEDTLPSWIGSIAEGRRMGPIAGVLISRHCCLLGTGSGKHDNFVAKETTLRAELEASLRYTAADWRGWTGALGFCDLLSLYLCSGSQSRVKLPLGHPEDGAKKLEVTLDWVDGHPCLSEPLLQQGATFSVEGYKYLAEPASVKAATFCWKFEHQI